MEGGSISIRVPGNNKEFKKRIKKIKHEWRKKEKEDAGCMGIKFI